MSDRPTSTGRALSLLIVSLTTLGAFLGVFVALTPAVQAADCGQSGGSVTGNWVVNTPQVCNAQFSLDGNLYIRAGGSLTLVNGGISFVQDLTHIKALFVDSTGSLILDNSTITTATNSLSPYVKLAATVNGTLVMRNHAMLKFPGTLNLNSGSVLNMTASTITGFSDSELNGLGNPGWIDDNDDSALMALTGATAYLYGSTIEKIYENVQPGGTAKNLTLVSGSVLYAYDSYIGVDFSNNWQVHNLLTVDSTSKAYLYNATIDQAQSDATPQYQRLPAFVPSGSGSINLLRWMHVTTTDPYGTAIVGATVWPHIGNALAQYPDNGNQRLPGSRTLWYLGRTAANWNVSDAKGRALMPLWTDNITVSSLPNAHSFGNYNATGRFNGSAAFAAATFPTYPSMTAADNNLNVTVAFNIPGLTPDLTVASVLVSGGNGNSDFQPLNTAITLTATIHNTGAYAVSNVPVDFFSTNVDINGDGIMDATVASFQAAGTLIASTTIPSVPSNGSAAIAAIWTVQGSFETGRIISVVVNPPLGDPSGPSAIAETNYRNNIMNHQVSLITWPDLNIAQASVQFLKDPVVNNPTQISVPVSNFGTNTATAASLRVYDNGVLSATSAATFNVGIGATSNGVVLWTPGTTGSHNLVLLVVTHNDTIRNVDYNMSNNFQSFTKTVLSQPDLALKQSDYAANITENQAKPFAVTIRIYNYGATPALNTSVAVYLDGNRSREIGRTSNIDVFAGTDTNVTVNVGQIATPGTHTLMVVVDPDNLIHEANENNNFANITVVVLPPQGTIYIGTPSNDTVFLPSDAISIFATVRDKAGNPISGLQVDVTVLRDGVAVSGLSTSAISDTNGQIQITLPLQGLADGNYQIRLSSSQGQINSGLASFSIHANVPFFLQPVPLLGIQWWLLLVIIAAVAGILIGVTVYFKVYGLGKMVECGECGAFIPEDATTCPKCGVEFEKDMAKCSNCQAWIPVDVKQCPECGVEFATGEVEMADYQEKMRLQYDEVVGKFKQEAQRQLGRALSDREFQEWWRKQATFVTFEDWLREEEEMRKMGSKPCPVCGTLNSVTATVCHKCGSLMKDQAPRPPSGGSGGVVQPSRPASPAPAQQPPPGGAQAGVGTVPAGTDAVRRVIRKPVTPGPAPIVQKKVIKRPAGEGEQADGDHAKDQTDQSEDEL